LGDVYKRQPRRSFSMMSSAYRALVYTVMRASWIATVLVVVTKIIVTATMRIIISAIEIRSSISVNPASGRRRSVGFIDGSFYLLNRNPFRERGDVPPVRRRRSRLARHPQDVDPDF